MKRDQKKTSRAGEIFLCVLLVFFFASSAGAAERDSISEEPGPPGDDELALHYARAADRITELSPARKGWCLVLGCSEGRLALEIARHTEMSVIAVDPDPGEVEKARRTLDRAGVYGTRVTVREAKPSKIPFPDYFANLIVSETSLAAGRIPWPADEVFRLLRPCGGRAVIGQTGGFPAAARLDRSRLRSWIRPFRAISRIVDEKGLWAVVSRGPLDGAGEWTHTYADPANTACSKDRYVHGPMEIQWFGRPGPRHMIDRHHRNVPPLYKKGRLFVPGDERVIVLDAYNGARLWDVEIPGSRRLGVFLDTSNMAVDEERLFVACGDRCATFDVATGAPAGTFRMPRLVDGRETHWSYVARAEDLVFGTGCLPAASYTETSREADAALWYDNMSVVTSLCFFAMDLAGASWETSPPPQPADPRWSYRSGVIINTTITIGNGRVYFIETMSPKALADPMGRMPARTFLEGDSFLTALDAKDGRVIYRKKVDLSDCRLIVYLNLGDGMLLMSGCRYEKKKLWYFFSAFRAATGELKWRANHDSNYDPGGGHGEQNRHPTIVGSKVYTYPYAYDLKSGRRLKGYAFSREGHGCGGVSASAGALFWRGGNPTMRDLGPKGTVRKINLVSRPGCWINIIPAGGLLLIPEASSGCTCSFPLQTSLAYRPAGR